MNGKCSVEWSSLFTGQCYRRSFLGSILGPMYFFICVSDLSGLHNWSSPLFKERIRFPKIKKGGRGRKFYIKMEWG